MLEPFFTDFTDMNIFSRNGANFHECYPSVSVFRSGDRFSGKTLQDVRYESTPAFADHTDHQSAALGKELVDGVTCFVQETEKLAKNPAALQAIRSTVASASLL